LPQANASGGANEPGVQRRGPGETVEPKNGYFLREIRCGMAGKLLNEDV
jgi:hypothetical protein